MLLGNSVVLWRDMHDVADKVCKNFGLSYGSILPETRKLVRYYGECQACDRCHANPNVDAVNCNEKILYIRTHQLNDPRKALAAATIVNTLVHELAHLRYWGHGKEHRAFEKEIMCFVKSL